MKRTHNLVRVATLSLATALFAAAPMFAQSGTQAGQMNPSSNTSQMSSSNVQLMTVDASLDKAINSSKLMQGQMVAAKTTMKVKTPDGVDLPKGTELMGKVSDVQGGQNGSMTRFSITFDQARLHDGRTVPIKATILGAMPPNSSYYGQNSFPDSSHTVSMKEKVDQEPGILHDIAMKSAVQSNVSGTFMSKKDKIDLNQGTQLRLALAPLASSNGEMNGAE
jgi:hypothetical protein